MLEGSEQRFQRGSINCPISEIYMVWSHFNCEFKVQVYTYDLRYDWKARLDSVSFYQTSCSDSGQWQKPNLKNNAFCNSSHIVEAFDKGKCMGWLSCKIFFQVLLFNSNY